MCMRKDEYLKLRKYIKSLCIDSVIELCDKVGLDDFEKNLIIHLNKNYTRVYTSMTLGICESAVSKKKHKILARIKDYLKRNNIPY